MNRIGQQTFTLWVEIIGNGDEKLRLVDYETSASLTAQVPQGDHRRPAHWAHTQWVRQKRAAYLKT